MKIECEQLYQEMLATLAKSQQSNGPETVECCFWIAWKYWDRLKKNRDKIFCEHMANEIYFFKSIKPRFTSQMQYCTILAEVMLFIPENTEFQVIYWKDELKRYSRFYEKNKDFVAYYDSGAMHLDNIYFTRASPDWMFRHPKVSYDMDRNYCSSHDHLVRGLLANRMYNEYVQERLAALEMSESGS